LIYSIVCVQGEYLLPDTPLDLSFCTLQNDYIMRMHKTPNNADDKHGI